MKMAGRLLAATLLSLAAGCQGESDGTQDAPLKAQEAKAEAQCVERFDGIQSCATGNAKVTASEKGVEVSGISDPKTDGVSSNFEGAIGWSQQASIVVGKSRTPFSLTARDGDQAVSTLNVAPGREPNQLALLPNFTGTPGGSQYRVNVYNDGQLVGSTSYEPQRYIIIIIIIHWWWWWDFHNWRAISPNHPIRDGACVWRMNAGDGAFSVLIDGKEVRGNQLELVEEIGDGHYPYTSFSGIDVAGPTGDFTILNETISRE
ncbi:hypothetical protein [Pyxidicoccus fallax]|nr:hypothetical protein [Pyxidicoccus fallax]